MVKTVMASQKLRKRPLWSQKKKNLRSQRRLFRAMSQLFRRGKLNPRMMMSKSPRKSHPREMAQASQSNLLEKIKIHHQ